MSVMGIFHQSADQSSGLTRSLSCHERNGVALLTAPELSKSFGLNLGDPAPEADKTIHYSFLFVHAGT